jgi:Domain of unknown function (DUF4279)
MAPDFPPGVYTVLGGDASDRKHTSFRLRGDRLEPDVITKLTGTTPDLAHKQGDVREQTGLQALSPWRSGLWMIDSAPAVAEVETRLEDPVTSLLDRLDPYADHLRQLRMREELKADFYCGYFMQQSNGGTEFTTSTLGRIVALGATLGIDIYAPDPGSLNRSIIVGS